MVAQPNSLSISLPDQLQSQFLDLLPRIETHARIYFRYIRCSDTRAEKVAETVAVAWRWFKRLAERGKDISRFVTVFIRYAARAVKCGRRAVGSDRANDVLSPVAQRRHGFTVESLPTSTQRSFESIHSVVKGQEEIDAYEERLHDNSVTPPPDAAAFRLDFPRFLGELSERDREMAMYLSLDHSGKRTAKRFGISPGRVTQLRRRWCEEWRASQGEKERVA